MPAYLDINKLKASQSIFVRSLTPPLPRNEIFLQPTPHQHFLSLPKSTIPSNVRIQNYLVNDKKLWQGINEVEKRGGKSTKDDGKEWREGKGRLARRMGGLKWAIRER